MKTTWCCVTVLISCLFGAGLQAAALRTELAGEESGEYPYFRYVRNFNTDEPVRVAVDPTRFPQLVGSTCDLYVVPARSEIGWTLDATLADVSGGVETVSIAAGDIQSNTFLAATAGTLPSFAGAGLGVGYDVVLDCNGNGLLDNPDLIDGRGDEPGLYSIHDTSKAGPLAVSEIDYSAELFLTQRTYYPTNIASMGRLPLVVISHGWTHDYTWYGHIGHHLASYGYVVMAHRNDVGAGNATATSTASITTLTNTDYLLGNLAGIGGGVLDGHVDSHRIAFIGHSTGAEGVVRAYTRLRTADFVPAHFSAEDVALVISMAPVSFHPIANVNPFDVNYLLILGAADLDTQNAPVASWVQPVSIYERARGNRQFIYIHGVGHEWLHTGNTPPLADGPDLIGRVVTHEIQRGYFLPVMELYMKENLAGRDFFTRNYQDYHPSGLGSNVIIANEYRDAASTEPVVIDDFQSQPSLVTTSAGQAVNFDVSNVAEVLMQDLDGSFAWSGQQPSNGMTRARFAGDDPRCVVFDWNGLVAFYELEVPPGNRDLSGEDFLSFRAAQGTRHPETDAINNAMSFTVELEDGNGTTGSLDFNDYGQITRPYLRTGYGSGAGWANEFNTIRIRLADFTTNGSGLNLSDIEIVRFRLGLSFDDFRGRIGLDDVEVVQAFEPAVFDLTVSRTGSTAEITWPPAVGALTYNVYRGTIPLGGLTTRGFGLAAYDHTCLEPADTLGDGWRSTTDPDPVPVDRFGFYYLVTAERTDAEGSAGLASVDLDPATAGVQPERPTPTPCP